MVTCLAYGCVKNHPRTAALAPENDSVEVEAVEAEVEPGYSDVPIQNSNLNICYSNIRDDATREVGTVGTFKGKELYYEFWSIPGGLSLTVNYLFLRSDTLFVEDYDFCFPELGTEYPPDSLLCGRYDKSRKEMVTDTSLTLREIPGFIQPLIIAKNGWQNLSRLNKQKDDYPKLFVRGETLVLQYWDYARHSDSWLIQETYSYHNRQFIPHKTDTLQTIVYDDSED